MFWPGSKRVSGLFATSSRSAGSCHRHKTLLGCLFILSLNGSQVRRCRRVTTVTSVDPILWAIWAENVSSILGRRKWKESRIGNRRNRVLNHTLWGGLCINKQRCAGENPRSFVEDIGRKRSGMQVGRSPASWHGEVCVIFCLQQVLHFRGTSISVPLIKWTTLDNTKLPDLHLSGAGRYKSPPTSAKQPKGQMN